MIALGKRSWIGISFAALLLVAAAGFGVWQFDFHRHAGSPGGEQAIIYTCPMHPQYTSDRPGDCPICGMTLVPQKHALKQEAAPQGTPAAGRTELMLDEAQQRRIGVTTAIVRKGPAVTTIRAAGRVAFDQDLVVAQREFLEARRLGDGELAKAAHRRLILMGMNDEGIKELARRGRPQEELVLPGKTAWVYAAIYERELPLVKAGQAAAIELPDGSTVGTGIVRAVDAILDPQTRTARARIVVDDPSRRLRPNMFVTAILQNDLGEKLLVPKSAVIATGTRHLVFLVHEGRHFMPRDIGLGAELAEDDVVESGLAAGDVVATGGLFLIDSESRLKAAAGTAGGHQHD